MTTMTCAEFLARYSDYDDSLVGASDLARFRDHLAACEACERYDRVLRKGRMLARQLPSPSPSPDFMPVLEDRLIGDTPAASVAGPGRAVAGAAALAVAGLMAVSSGLWLADGGAVARTADAAVAGVGGGAPVHEHPVDAGYEPSSSMPVTVDDGRALLLPRLAWDDPADWTAARVDRRVASSYSPVVTGPPAYRGQRVATTGSTLMTRITLD